MHNLINKYFNKTITSEEKQILFSEISKNDRLKMEFASIQNINALMGLLPTEYDQIEGYQKLLSLKQRQKKKTATLPLKHIIGYAASIFIAILSTWAITKPQQTIEEEEPVITYEEISAPAGQRALVKLHDGTTVWLNANSSLRYPNLFSGTERKVELNGEALFDVKEDLAKPFIVATEKVDIEVLGTIFNVFAYQGKDDFNTSLIEGVVKIYDPNDVTKKITLTPNERAELINNKFIKTTFSNRDFLLWKDGIYAFDDLPFGDIVKKLELYYDTSIEITNKQINRYKFSGKFRQRDGVENVLRTLQKVKKFNYTKDDDKNSITIT